MKRLFGLVILIIILVVPCLYAQPLGRLSTDRLGSSTLVWTGPCVLYGAFVITDGTNNATLTIYDNTSAAGKILRQITVVGGNYYGGFELPVGIAAGTGIYASLSGAGTPYFFINFGR